MVNYIKLNASSVFYNPEEAFFMQPKKPLYKSVIKYSFLCFSLFLLTKTVRVDCFLGLSFYTAAMYLGFNPLIASAAFVVSFAPLKSLGFIAAALIVSVAEILIFTAYRKRGARVRGELIVYCAFFAAVFVPFAKNSSLVYSISQGAVTVAATFAFILAERAIVFKRLDYKTTVEENVAVSLYLIAAGLGFIRYFGLNAMRAADILLILYAVYLFNGDGRAVTAAIVLSLPSAVFTLSFSPVAAYALLAVAGAVFIKTSYVVSAFVILLTDLIFMVFFKLYGAFSYFDVFYDVVPTVLFVFTPTGFLKSIRKRVCGFEDKGLKESSLNKLRANLSSKLYDISDVFTEMQTSFLRLKESVGSENEIIEKMADEVIKNVCDACPWAERCRQKGIPEKEELIKILTVGVAKSRASFIDLTKNFTENCGYANSIVYEMNALISKYKEKLKESRDVSGGKELVTMQSEGVAEALKGLAANLNASISENADMRKTLRKKLSEYGILADEIVCYGDDEPFSELILKKDDLLNDNFYKAAREAFGEEIAVTEKRAISSARVAVTVKRAPKTDAAFGLSVKKKNGSLLSGDTHSLIKISEGKFLIALSDGMGSGINAENTSNAAISLIESFYKAGLKSELILSIANKALAFNLTDDFSAVDVLTADLYKHSLDFIKIGAPYSFVITDDSIRIVDGSSLPLGIMDDLTPSVSSLKISGGATAVMFTDGVSDSFGSVTDFIDFLKTLSALNPQVLSDAIMREAVKNLGGEIKDDMTVLAVRFYEKAS